jgi:hypothetical protein
MIKSGSMEGLSWENIEMRFNTFVIRLVSSMQQVNTVFVFTTVAGQTKICDVQGMRCLGNYSGKN